jgi:hypothetical protein
VSQELQAHRARIEQERVVYRQRVKQLKARDDEQSAKLRILEETLSDKARNERRKLFFEQAAAPAQPQHQSVSGAGGGASPEWLGAEDVDLAAYEARLHKVSGCLYCGYVRRGSYHLFCRPRAAFRGYGHPHCACYRTSGAVLTTSVLLCWFQETNATSDDASSRDSRSEDSTHSHEDTDPSSSGTSDSDVDTVDHTHHDHHNHSHGTKRSTRRRVKQTGVRTVAPLCDPRTEGLLGITHEHTKRQEITASVNDHIPRPAVANVTGSETGDSAVLAKAQKLYTALSSPIPAATEVISASADCTVVAPRTEGWTESNSAPRISPVRFNTRDGSYLSAASPGRRLSTFSSSKVKFGFWADAEPQDLNDSTSSDGGDGGAHRGNSAVTVAADAKGASKSDRRERAVAVHSLTSTACYVSLYYRYLKKSPNLNFRRDNPRLQGHDTAQPTQRYAVFANVLAHTECAAHSPVCSTRLRTNCFCSCLYYVSSHYYTMYSTHCKRIWLYHTGLEASPTINRALPLPPRRRPPRL